jgi:hypothetical protein
VLVLLPQKMPQQRAKPMKMLFQASILRIGCEARGIG